MRILHTIGLVLLGQRGHLFPWIPVCFGLGIGLFFLLRFEPSGAVLWGAAIFGGLCLAGPLIAPLLGPIFLGVGIVALGFSIAGLRAHQVAEPVLSFRYYGPVEGRVVGIDRSASDAVRLTLDRVVLSRVAPHKTPARVRISLHGVFDDLDPTPGQTIMTTGHLSPPGGPVEPGGFDFQRHSWFQRLGAVGYTRVPVVLLEPAEGAVDLAIFRMRMAISAYVQARLPGESGAFAAAVTTGDRSGMGQGTLQSLRDSNLAHLIAISGLHMGLLAGFVYGALRLVIAAIPYVALRVPSKKIAAVGALGAASFYLALSGGAVSTERAFIMVAMALVAILFGRRAISLRAVALAASIVLFLRPEALLNPGFQMSFAATTALVAVFGALRNASFHLGPVWARGAVGVVLSSAVAGFATGPIGAVHFNQVSHFGLVANLISVPVMGVLVMPVAVVALVLKPFGLDGLAFGVMGWGLEWILGAAHWASGLPGAVGHVMRPPAFVLPGLTMGALFLILWRGRARWAGLLPMVAAFALWAVAARPPVLIADTGALLGVMTEDGRALSREKGSGFIARNWLENDGDGASQPVAAGRGGEAIAFGPLRLRHVHGKRDVAALTECGADVLVLSHPAPGLLGCEVFDPPRLADLGAVALYPAGRDFRIVTARDLSGTRLWNDQ
ncbi:competence protein ComEC [Poseidonocella pacifica]|uniref:Competence protein ComEC n=1 Tax=Poseidonocella pacifica TaxID=871651 RepID=A0A1I0VSY3_9RHOB|nr:ComEC/Rec2 family competence protein [Poseidonocella pacifica]SFA78806.1 competence protein ComEC [Poseidonocella pacifica]